MRVHRLARLECPLRVGHHDVGRQRIALRAEAVEDPGAHARETRDQSPGEQLVLGRRVDDHVAVARPDHGDVVDATGDVGEEVGDFDAALPILSERATGAQQPGVTLNLLILHVAELFRARLALELVQQRLGIEGLEMAGPSGHEQEDHRGRLGRDVDRPGGQGIVHAGAEPLPVQDRGEGQAADAAEGVADELPARAGRAGMGAGVTRHTGTHSG